MDSTRVRERLYSRTVIDLDGPRPVDDSPCWHWTGGRHKKTGYGQFSVGKTKGILAHRASYQLAKGPIPGGLTIDHVCHKPKDCKLAADCPHRACVNPAHLEAVPPRVNVLRGGTIVAANAAKTECDKGHEFTEANTYRFGEDGRHRACRTCEREKRQRSRDEARALAPADTCNNGHQRTPENRYANGTRGCRQCQREGSLRGWEKRKAG